MACPYCKIPPVFKPLDSTPNFCRRCGQALKQACASCDGSGRDPRAGGFCGNCGAPQAGNCAQCGGSGKVSVVHACPAPA